MSMNLPMPGELRYSRLFIGADQWVPVSIPDGAKWVSILINGPGGNGGTGFTGIAGAARAGGGAGGSGCVAFGFYQTSIWTPSQLYLYLPAAAGATARAQVMIDTLNQNAWTLLLANSGNNGNNGAGSGGTNGGTGGTVMSVTAAGLQTFGQWMAQVGNTGANGGNATGAVGSSVTWGLITNIGIFTQGGAGGAGVTAADFAGGNCNGGVLTPTSAGGAAGSNNGADGAYQLLAPNPWSTGGAGGGSSNSGVGGNGGNGAPGSGGGGGGGGTTGGAGGLGGPAFAMVGWG